MIRFTINHIIRAGDNATNLIKMLYGVTKNSGKDFPELRLFYPLYFQKYLLLVKK
jgi:hypothetical protein